MRNPSMLDLLSASYSCIYIETRDFEGAELMVRDAVTSLNESGHRMMPVDREGGTEKEPVRTQFGVWTITEGTSLYELNSILDGARIPNPAPEKQTASLPQALNLIKASRDSIVMVYHNPRTLVSSNPAHNQNVQLIVEAAMLARQKFSCLVFIGQAWDIPPELDSLVYRFDWPLPTQEQLVELCLDKVILPNLDNVSFLTKPGKKERPETGESRSVFRKRKLYELNREVFDEVARAASGLDPLNAENAFALSLTMNDTLDPKIIQEQKRQIIKKSGALEFFSTEETMDDVGGFGRLKTWILRRRGAFTREAELAGIPYPKGVLFVGPPGTGKSLVAKAISSGLGLPLVRFDISKVKGSLVGESLHGDQEIYVAKTKTGHGVSRYTIREMFEKNIKGFVLTYTDRGAFKWGSVTEVIRHERKESFLKITTRRGYSVVVTEGHSLFIRSTIKGVKFGDLRNRNKPILRPVEAKSLEVGTKIAAAMAWSKPNQGHDTQRLSLEFFNVDLTVDLMLLAGLWIADGSLNNGQLRISSHIQEVDIEALILRLCPTVTELRKSENAVDRTLNSFALSGLFHAMGLVGKQQQARTKRVPAWIFGLNNKLVAAFLKGYFSGDGYFGGHVLEATTASEKLAYDIAGLLMRFGISPGIHKKPVPSQHRNHFRIDISKALEIGMFERTIGFLQEAKQRKLRAFLATKKQNGYARGRKTRSIKWDAIKSIEPFQSNDPYSYDLSVAETEKFVSNWVVVHNSEGNMRRNLQITEAIAPVVLWVDELEKALAGWKSGNDSGVAKSITGQFLQWRQETKAPIFICCTCNDVESIPPEFYRPGRIDAIFATSLPNLQERMEIFKIHLRKKKQKPKRFEIKQLAIAAKKFTGAEIELAITEAIFEMFASKTKLTTEMIYDAIKQIVPQSKRSGTDLKAVEAWAAERAIPVSDAISHGTQSTNRPQQGRVISKSEG